MPNCAADLCVSHAAFCSSNACRAAQVQLGGQQPVRQPPIVTLLIRFCSKSHCRAAHPRQKPLALIRFRRAGTSHPPATAAPAVHLPHIRRSRQLFAHRELGSRLPTRPVARPSSPAYPPARRVHQLVASPIAAARRLTPSASIRPPRKCSTSARAAASCCTCSVRSATHAAFWASKVWREASSSAWPGELGLGRRLRRGGFLLFEFPRSPIFGKRGPLDSHVGTQAFQVGVCNRVVLLAFRDFASHTAFCSSNAFCDASSSAWRAASLLGGGRLQRVSVRPVQFPLPPLVGQSRLLRFDLRVVQVVDLGSCGRILLNVLRTFRYPGRFLSVERLARGVKLGLPRGELRTGRRLRRGGFRLLSFPGSPASSASAACLDSDVDAQAFQFRSCGGILLFMLSHIQAIEVIFSSSNACRTASSSA